MGYTRAGEALCLHRGDKVGERDIISNERGQALPRKRSCPFCWYFGEREICEDDNRGKKLSLLQKGEDVFVCGPGIPIPPSVESNAVCLAGLETDNDAVELTIVRRPLKRSCYQHRTCKPYR